MTQFPGGEKLRSGAEEENFESGGFYKASGTSQGEEEEGDFDGCFEGVFKMGFRNTPSRTR